ncbi:MAG: M23 family metallopeptidase [Spirochaetia bacterium]|nr:M23 family metallopeptidase [Spirochaetia bacterium]
MKMTGKLKQKRKTHLTLMVVPDDTGKIISVKLGAGLFLSIMALWLCSVVVSAYVISRHVDYRATKAYDRFLNQKHQEFAKEMLEMRDSVKRTVEIDSQLRDLLQLKSKNAVIKYTGFGGPSYLDTKLLEKSVKDGDEVISRKAFELAVRYVDEQSKYSEKSFQQIIQYITEQRSRLTAVPSGWPVKGWITAAFGSRIDPFTGSLSFHAGVDIANDIATPIKTTADGVVTFAELDHGGYGNLVTINHGNGYMTKYAHLLKIIVSPGQHVKKGQVIAYLGTTGRSTAPHLHYEIKLNGAAVSPVKYLNKEVALK